MNKLITTDLGGFPFLLDDLRFMDEAQLTGLTLAIKGLNRNGANCTVQGVEIGALSGSLTPVSAGLLLVDGELVLVDAHDITGGAIELFDFVKVVIADSYDSAGTKNFESGVTFEAYRLRRATLVGASGTPGVDDIVYRDSAELYFKPIHENILGALVEAETGWRTLSPAFFSGVSAWATFGGGGGTMVYKKLGRIAMLNLKADYEFSGSNTYFEFDIPGGIVPSYDRMVGMATINNGSGFNLCRVIALTTGKLQIAVTSGNLPATGTVEFNVGPFAVNS